MDDYEDFYEEYNPEKGSYQGSYQEDSPIYKSFEKEAPQFGKSFKDKETHGYKGEALAEEEGVKLTKEEKFYKEVKRQIGLELKYLKNQDANEIFYLIKDQLLKNDSNFLFLNIKLLINCVLYIKYLKNKNKPFNQLTLYKYLDKRNKEFIGKEKIIDYDLVRYYYMFVKRLQQLL